MLTSSILRSAARMPGAATLLNSRQYSISAGKYASKGLYKRPTTSVYPSGSPVAQRLLPLSSIRFNSTIPSSSQPIVPETVEPFDSVSPLDFTTLTEAQKIIPEKIGFLHELGLNFGWGPTSCIQWLMEHVHVWSGLPWWGSIVAMTVIIRALQFPGYIKMSDTAAKMKEVQPFANPIFERIKRAQAEKNMMALQLAKQQLTDVYLRAGVKRKWLMFPLFQIPVFFGVYNLLRHMAELPVPGLLNGGVAWFPDLSAADPLLVLPIATSVLLGATIGMGGDAGAQSFSPQVKRLMTIGLPLLSFLFMWKWAAAMTIYFATNGLLGFCQNLLLRNPAFRDWMGIYPIVKAADQSHQFSTASALEGKPKPDASGMLGWAKEFVTANEAEKKNPGVVSNWKKSYEDSTKQKKYDDYEAKRAAEEARRKKAIVEQKKRAKTML